MKVKFTNLKVIGCSFNAWNILKEYRVGVDFKYHSDFTTKANLVDYYGIKDIKKIGGDTYYTRNKTTRKIPIYEGTITKNINL